MLNIDYEDFVEVSEQEYNEANGWFSNSFLKGVLNPFTLKDDGVMYRILATITNENLHFVTCIKETLEDTHYYINKEELDRTKEKYSKEAKQVKPTQVTFNELVGGAFIL